MRLAVLLAACVLVAAACTSSTDPTSTTVADTTATAPTTTSTTTTVPRTTTTTAATTTSTLAEIRDLPAGMFCRDLLAMGYVYEDAIHYWVIEGETDRMDADRNGIPCETVWPEYVVKAYWGDPLPTTTTTAPTTTTTTAADPPPPPVTGVTAGLGGGSGEVYVQWNASPAPDLDRYALYYSQNPGGSKAFLANVDAGTEWYVDFPRDLTAGINCYQVSAIDTGGDEGQRSAEVCFDPG